MAEWDVVVVSAGLVGSTAALFSARQSQSTLVVDAGLVPGGQMFNIARIEDFPGFPQGVASYDLCPMLQEQAAAAVRSSILRPSMLCRRRSTDGR